MINCKIITNFTYSPNDTGFEVIIFDDLFPNKPILLLSDKEAEKLAQEINHAAKVSYKRRLYLDYLASSKRRVDKKKKSNRLIKKHVD